MNRQVRDGLGGLCFAAIAAIVGFALSGTDSSDLARIFYVVAGLVAVVSLIAVARGVTAGDESS
jgi:uncharacterized membrane protein YuzA (DUF378 family)